MSLYGTVTRLAPAGRHPPEPSHQIHTFMRNCGFLSHAERWSYYQCLDAVTVVPTHLTLNLAVMSS